MSQILVVLEFNSPKVYFRKEVHTFRKTFTYFRNYGRKWCWKYEVAEICVGIIN